MKDLAGTSPAVAAFLEETTTMLRRMLSNALSTQVRSENLPLAVEAFITAVDGAHARGLPTRERRRVLRFTLTRILGGPSI